MVRPNSRFQRLIIEAGRVFRPAAPVDERALFAGRGKQITLVMDAISQPGQHAVIFGERGVGKTSLANVLSQFLDIFGVGDKMSVCRRVNCDSSDDFSSVWKKVFEEIRFAISAPGIGFKAPDVTTTVSVLDGMPAEVTPNSVRSVLESLAVQHDPIIIIDEFDRLNNHSVSEKFADCIKMLSDQAVRATVILVGVADSVDELIKEHASVERALVQIPMPRMSVEEINEIINNGLKRLGMKISSGALQQIAFLAQGLPHYAHLLGLHSCRAALQDESLDIDIRHVETAIKNATETAQQSIRTAYTKAISSPRKESLFRQVLLACALADTDELGYFSAADVRQPMSTIMETRYDIPSFARHLKEFSEPIRGQVLSKTGPERRVRYRFVNPLMQPHVIMRGVADGLVGQEAVRKLRST